MTVPTLPREFWEATPVLGTLRTFARSRILSPDALLGHVLGEVAAHTPPGTTLPPVVGASSCLNVLHAYAGGSGSGKTSTARAVRDVLAVDSLALVSRMPVGSGEGLSRLYLDDKGEPVTDTAVVTVDEVETLTRLAERRGATLLPTLRSAWSGAELGTRNRSDATSGVVAAGTYRLVAHVGVQPMLAGALLEADGGTTQRVVWFTMADPDADAAAEWHGRGILWLPPTSPRSLCVDPVVAHGIKERASESRRRGGDGTGHSDLVRLRLAALLALLHDEPGDVTAAWWDLAGAITATSDAIVDGIKREQAHASRARSIAAGVARADVDDVVAETVEERARGKARDAVVRYLTARAGEASSSRTIAHGVNARHRPYVAGILDDLVARGDVVTVPVQGASGPATTGYLLR